MQNHAFRVKTHGWSCPGGMAVSVESAHAAKCACAKWTAYSNPPKRASCRKRRMHTELSVGACLGMDAVSTGHSNKTDRSCLGSSFLVWVEATPSNKTEGPSSGGSLGSSLSSNSESESVMCTSSGNWPGYQKEWLPRLQGFRVVVELCSFGAGVLKLGS